MVLDVIAGTSAGGINGVCLARGLAEGRSLNGFKLVAKISRALAAQVAAIKPDAVPGPG